MLRMFSLRWILSLLVLSSSHESQCCDETLSVTGRKQTPPVGQERPCVAKKGNARGSPVINAIFALILVFLQSDLQKYSTD